MTIFTKIFSVRILFAIIVVKKKN